MAFAVIRVVKASRWRTLDDPPGAEWGRMRPAVHAWPHRSRLAPARVSYQSFHHFFRAGAGWEGSVSGETAPGDGPCLGGAGRRSTTAGSQPYFSATARTRL